MNDIEVELSEEEQELLDFLKSIRISKSKSSSLTKSLNGHQADDVIEFADVDLPLTGSTRFVVTT